MRITTVITKIWGQVKQLFDGAPAEIKTAIHIGVIVTDNIKAFIDSAYVDVLTALIPCDMDDQVKQLLKAMCIEHS